MVKVFNCSFEVWKKGKSRRWFLCHSNPQNLKMLMQIKWRWSSKRTLLVGPFKPHLVNVEATSNTIQVDPATATSHIQLFLAAYWRARAFRRLSSRGPWRSTWRRSRGGLSIVAFWRFGLGSVSASNTGVHQPESHFSILSSRTFVITKEVATCIDLTSLLILASPLHQIQLVFVAFSSLGATV